MGTSIFRGMVWALIVTASVLVIILALTWWGIGSQYMLLILDAGLVMSCIAAGYRSSYTSNQILPGILAVLAYVLMVILLLSLYFPIIPLGAVKIMTGAVLLAMVSALAGKGRSMYSGGVTHEDIRPYQGQKPRAKGSLRSLSSISVEHSKEAEGWQREGGTGHFNQKESYRIPDWWERGRRNKD